jgi:hypothetical protein
MVLSVVDTRAWLGRRCGEMELDEQCTSPESRAVAIRSNIDPER